MDRDRSREPSDPALGLFEEALGIAEEDRDAWIDAHCGADRALATRVRRLLARAASGTDLPALADVVDLAEVF
ncbi:MAG TPA: hypothetical protein ENJ09_00585, partial [Planctomycetes bacterium]|nr:hypothetical protein [Planctomycetota bacterium]